jgi:hypothetical protein
LLHVDGLIRFLRMLPESCDASSAPKRPGRQVHDHPECQIEHRVESGSRTALELEITPQTNAELAVLLEDWEARQELGAKEQKKSEAVFVNRASSMAMAELISRLSVWTSQQKGIRG